MPLFDKNRSLLDNLSDVLKEHKSLIILIIVLKWITKNKWIIIVALILIFIFFDRLLMAIDYIFS